GRGLTQKIWPVGVEGQDRRAAPGRVPPSGSGPDHSSLQDIAAPTFPRGLQDLRLHTVLYEEGPGVQGGTRGSLVGEWCSFLYRLLMGGAGRWEVPAGPVQARVVRRPERW